MPTIKQRGDRDISPRTGPILLEKEMVLAPGPPSKWTARQIETVIDQWVEAETKRKGKKPSLGAINRFRDQFTERFQEAMPEVEPTPEVQDITPTTRIRGA
jgi:hypothetical protein